VSYRSTETLYFNEYWYEYEQINEGNELTFSIQSSPSLISFAVWDRPFENLPTTSKTGLVEDQFSLENNDYEYFSLFLRPGSEIEYDFTANHQIDFFITDASNLNEWNQYGNPSFYYEINTVADDGSFQITEAQDYYLVWYNEGSSTASVEISVEYVATEVIDFSVTDYYQEGVYSVPQTTITVPNDGNWYFFVYFDPMNSPDESTTITFDVSYETGVTSTDRWSAISPILIGVIVVVGIIIIIAFVARKSQKKMKPKSAKTSTVQAPTKSPYKKATPSTIKCVRCGNTLKTDSKYCPKCGGKVEGRTFGAAPTATIVKTKICSFCGSKLKTTDKFCKFCGSQIKK
jgi:ribosomal protein L37E